MGTTIIFRRGENDPTSGSGLTLAEPAFNTTLKTFHIGLGHGITAAWVGAPISGLSADIAAGITYKIPTASAVKNYIGGLCYGNTGAATITQYVSSFNGLTGAVGGVCAAQSNTFTALQSFASGISASGITVGGSMTVTGNLTVSGGVTFTISENVLIEDNIITLNSNVTGSPSENAGIEIERGTSANVQLLWNESSDKWTFTNDGTTYYDMPTSAVISFNGLTGAVGGACAAQTNTFVPIQYFVGGLCSGSGITAESTVSSVGFFTGYPGYQSITTVSPDTVKFAFDPSGDNSIQTLRPSDDLTGLAGGTITNRLPASSGILALTSQLMGAVNGSTAATSAVTSFNGLTGAVGGVCAAQANTFTAVQTFNSGVTFASTIDATGAVRFNGGLTASRIDITGNFKVVGDAQVGDQNTDSLTVFAGTTFNNRTDFAGSNNFATGLTSSGNIRFSGTTAKTIISSQAPLTISGATTSVIASPFNSIVFGVQTTDPLTVYSATGVVDISTNNPLTPVQPALRFNTDDQDFIGPGSIKIEPITYATAARTQYLQDANGTIALTSQLMGAVNGSTAATTAVTSLNGLTGTVGITGGTDISVSLSGKTLTINYAGSASPTNVVTSFNGLTGAVTGVTVGGANTFTALNSFGAGISASGATFAADIRVNTMTVGRGSTSGAVSNTALGVNVLALNSGTFNTGVGNSALTANTTGGSNTAVGRRALFANTTGSSNTAIGPSALGAVTSGVFNTAIGPNTLTATTVNNSTAVGAGAIQYNVSGNDNTAVGAFAGTFWGDGETGTILSNQMLSATGGVYIGYYARGSTLNRINEIVIGANAVGGGSNTAVIGATSQTSATVYGLLNAPAGVCAAGATFTGSVFLNPANRIYTTPGETIYFGNSGFSEVEVNNDEQAIRLWANGTEAVAVFTDNVTIAPPIIGYTASFTTLTSNTMMYARAVYNITGATTALASSRTDYVYNATSGTFTLTMPTAVSNINRYTIKNSGTGVVTIGCTASQTIDGDSTYPLSTQYQAVDLISNGTNWMII
jgi:hypothetical protein